MGWKEREAALDLFSLYCLSRRASIALWGPLCPGVREDSLHELCRMQAAHFAVF